MRKRLAILVLLTVGLPVYGQQEGSQAAANQEGSSGVHAPYAPAKAISCKIEQNGTTIECQYSEADAKGYFGRLFSAENLPNLLLVGVGLGAIGAAVKTLREVKRQADLMKQQADIQEASMRQWVDVELMDVRDTVILANERPESVIVTHVHFRAINSTPLPLTITKIITRLSGPQAADWIPFTVDETTIIPPSKDYPFFVPITLTRDAAERYLTGQSNFAVSGQVFFVEAVGKPSEQGFSFVVSHGHHSWKIMEFIGKQPTENQPDSQNPN